MGTVSVALATYNGEKYLRAQLQSLLDQTRRPDEVIICDDASRDGTVALATCFIETHGLQGWKILVNDTNVGYIRNFRRAMEATTGEIVFLCDQDDIWELDKVQIMTQVLERYPRIDALVSGYSLMDSYGNSSSEQARKFYNPPFWAKRIHQVRQGRVLYANMAQGCTGVYRRSLVDQYCVCSCNTIAHDWALHMIAYDCGRLFYIHRELVRYRIHEANTIGLSGASRVDILNKDRESMLDAQQLPLSQKGRLALMQIADFYQLRLQAIESGNCIAWLKGWGRFPQWILHSFFWQYMKDFYVMVRWRIGVLRQKN